MSNNVTEEFKPNSCYWCGSETMWLRSHGPRRFWLECGRCDAESPPCEWAMPTNEFINNAARMASLLERAENLITYYEDKHEGQIISEAHEWLSDFAAFQKGEGNG